jgi:hypothetical protein
MVTFCWKNYQSKNGDRKQVMRLSANAFIRRFLIHVLSERVHRICHYGLLASARRKVNIANSRTLLWAEQTKHEHPETARVIPLTLREPCPDCGGEMRIIETFRRDQKPRSRTPPREQAAASLFSIKPRSSYLFRPYIYMLGVQIPSTVRPVEP